MERAKGLRPRRAALAAVALLAAVAWRSPRSSSPSGSGPLIERLPWFPFLARHHYLHHLDVESNANFLLPFADWLFGTLRLPEPGTDLLAAGRAMAPKRRATMAAFDVGP